MLVKNVSKRPVKLDSVSGGRCATIDVGESFDAPDYFAASVAARISEKSLVVCSAEAPQIEEIPEAERLPKIIEAVQLILKTGDASKLDPTGKPKTTALKDIVGFKVTAAERDAAFAAGSEGEGA